MEGQKNNIMTTPYEQYAADPTMHEQLKTTGGEANYTLLELFEKGEIKTGISYAEIINNSELMRLFVKGSHLFQLDGAPDVTVSWTNERQFVADFIADLVAPMQHSSILDVGSSNGLFLKTVEGTGAAIVPYGLERSALENHVARLVFPEYLQNFITVDLDAANTRYQSPQELTPELPEAFDVIYWPIWSGQGNFSDMEGKMSKLLFMFAHWVKAPQGRLLFGFYDQPRDEEHKRDLVSLKITPCSETRNTTNIESIWELNPQDVIKMLGHRGLELTTRSQ